MPKAPKKRAEAKVMFQARLSLESERRRRRLVRAMGDCTNGDLLERAFVAMEREVARQPDSEAAA